MTNLHRACQSIIDEYGDRYQRISKQLDGLSNRTSPFADELRDMKSLYAEIVASALKFVPADIRMARAKVIGGHCDIAAKDLELVS